MFHQTRTPWYNSGIRAGAGQRLSNTEWDWDTPHQRSRSQPKILSLLNTGDVSSLETKHSVIEELWLATGQPRWGENCRDRRYYIECDKSTQKASLEILFVQTQSHGIFQLRRHTWIWTLVWYSCSNFEIGYAIGLQMKWGYCSVWFLLQIYVPEYWTKFLIAQTVYYTYTVHTNQTRGWKDPIENCNKFTLSWVLASPALLSALPIWKMNCNVENWG